MPLQWSYERRADAGVIYLTGHLGARSADRFAGAVGWALARHTRAIVVDVTSLLGWSADGQAAIADGAQRLAAHGCALHLCGAHDLPPLAAAGPPLPVPLHADLDAALAALRRDEPTS